MFCPHHKHTWNVALIDPELKVEHCGGMAGISFTFCCYGGRKSVPRSPQKEDLSLSTREFTSC